MKKFLFLLTFCIAFVSCNVSANNENEKNSRKNEKKDCLEVLSFHSKQRCITCRTIEESTEKILKTDFPDELENGKILFKIIDISERENEGFADKYEVTWSSLFLVRHINGKEKVENLTEFAFANARKSPEKFRKGLTDKINEMLK